MVFFLPQPRFHPRLWCSSCKSFSHCPRGFRRSCWQGFDKFKFQLLFSFCSSRESFLRLCNTLNISPSDSFFKGFLRSLFHLTLPANMHRNKISCCKFWQSIKFRWTKLPSQCQTCTTSMLTSQNSQEFPVWRIQLPGRWTLDFHRHCHRHHIPVYPRYMARLTSRVVRSRAHLAEQIWNQASNAVKILVSWQSLYGFVVQLFGFGFGYDYGLHMILKYTKLPNFGECVCWAVFFMKQIKTSFDHSFICSDVQLKVIKSSWLGWSSPSCPTICPLSSPLEL